MNKDLPLVRLYLLRALYLLVVVGLGSSVWPDVVQHHAWPLMEGIVQCMLAGFSGLCLLGLRYPLRMLPLLLWELAWKAVWLGTVAYPLWSAGRLDHATTNMALTCLIVVIFPFAMPWDYIYDRYVRQRGERWR
ncbi:MAG: hypothetical protein V4641_34740 [Pseudomonadota bacterium]|jgi:hypothetical protein